jgi:hypothetical protein
MRDALDRPELLGGAIPGESWAPWRTLLIAAMGEALTDDERELFTTLTGREREPQHLVEEFWGIVGRRGGKTRAAGTLAAYVAGLCDHTDYLAPGERGVLPILAASTSQATRAFMHTKGILQHSPELRTMIEGEPTSDTIRLRTRVDIEVKPANFRTIRSITAVAAICDEVAFWMIENSANPDTEILNALRPSLATTSGPLAVISSPYAKKGELYGAYKRDYGPTGDPLVLVAKGPSRTFNSTLKQATVDRAYQRDAASAAAEYGGEFRNDVEAFVSRDTVEACVTAGIAERPPVAGVAYRAFVDPSGGGADSMTLAIGHQQGDRAIVDALRERRPPFSPEGVVEDFAAALKSYGISEVTGDRYAGEWPREAFRRHGIAYRLADQAKSALYQDMLPVLNSQRVELVDVPVVVSQIANLERRVARGGRESIDHPPRGHDDLANAIAGLVGLCIRKAVQPTAVFGTYSTSAGSNPLVGGWSSRRPKPADALPPPQWAREPRSESYTWVSARASR